MRYFTLMLTLIFCTACSAQPIAQSSSAGIKPHNAEQGLQVRDLQGGDVQMKQRRVTVLSNVQIAPTDGGAVDAQTIARVAGHTIRRAAKDTVAAQSPYIGAAFQHDSQEVGLISKEIAIHFTSAGIPVAYQKWDLQELVKGSGIYVLTVTDLKQWTRTMRQLLADSQIQSVEARIVTTERQAR